MFDAAKIHTTVEIDTKQIENLMQKKRYKSLN